LDELAQAILAPRPVAKEPKQMKSNFEIDLCGYNQQGKLKQRAKSLEDPNDWETVEKYD